MATLLDSINLTTVTDWLTKWRQLNNFTGMLTNSSFDQGVMQYTPEEYKRAGINLIPVPGRTVKFLPTAWQPALDRARLQMRLDESRTAQKAAQQSEQAQQDILTEAEKTAEEVKKKARQATGRKATILTNPRGVTQLPGVSNLSGTILGNPLKTLLGQ